MSIATDLYHLLANQNIVFVTWTPDITNFVPNRRLTLKLQTKTHELEVLVPHDNFPSFMGILSASLFGEERIVIGWDLKQLFSYLKFRAVNGVVATNCQFFDLKLCEAFLSISSSCPLSFEEAKQRLKVLANNPQLIEYNKRILNPLLSEVVPGIEIIGVINRADRLKQYSNYNIEGQVNGRMSASVVASDFFNPHTLSSEEKNKFYAGHEKKFLVFDYKHMEISVLAWLSKDEKLQNIISSGKDLYSEIYKEISGSAQCSPKSRKFIKEALIAIVYGCYPKTLSEILGTSINSATYLIDSLNSKFPSAFGWLRDCQEKLNDNKVINNCFGRVMNFNEREAKTLRNALVQGPAALICLEKLIELYRNKVSSMEIIASIHDAYVCIADSSCEMAVEYAKQILESPSYFAPDCLLKVGVQIGDNWGNLIAIN